MMPAHRSRHTGMKRRTSDLGEGACNFEGVNRSRSS
ncbi:hypothetical protein DHOM_10525 [Dermabacter hominis 1368]|uniref:Uncharacterized protein n=1 Tax=Dermabacter hominis 1368 TaxID=1450519 RepID=A0ABR4SIQ8_9MICO|nr:hypothetical protein DHOM_10525 [Dermabacter hominis 1368]